MKRWTIGLAALLVASLFSTMPARAATSVGISVHVGDPYRGTSLTFVHEPDVVLVPETEVYYVRNYDDDLYRYGSYWYFVQNGYWYRAHSWRGPFVNVSFTAVPHPVRVVPVHYRRNWYGPPPHAVAHGYYHRHEVVYHEEHGHGNGAHGHGYDEHGHGNGHGHDR